MDVPPLFLRAIEDTAFSIWLRESNSFFGFWFVLTFHALGMGSIVGASVVIALRLVGVVPDLPLAPLKRLYPFIWVGFWIQVASGILLLIAYPTKSLTNATFYVKLALIWLGMVTMVRLKRVFDDASLSDVHMMAKGKALATWSLVFWFGTLTAGRFLAYTATYMTYPRE